MTLGQTGLLLNVLMCSMLLRTPQYQ
uniref:Uncharacterized protein n=1 Tax=Anguilla anguilla TaxID=7936 RepID=A0A0E9PE28_ANGAN